MSLGESPSATVGPGRDEPIFAVSACPDDLLRQARRRAAALRRLQARRARRSAACAPRAASAPALRYRRAASRSRAGMPTASQPGTSRIRIEPRGMHTSPSSSWSSTARRAAAACASRTGWPGWGAPPPAISLSDFTVSRVHCEAPVLRGDAIALQRLREHERHVGRGGLPARRGHPALAPRSASGGRCSASRRRRGARCRRRLRERLVRRARRREPRDAPALRRPRADRAATDATVLIQGETGTGKDVVARSLHAASPRAAGSVRRRQLRGHPREPHRERALRPRARRVQRRGLRTGKGVFEEAHGGTLFLDEIGEMPLGAPAQAPARHRDPRGAPRRQQRGARRRRAHRRRDEPPAGRRAQGAASGPH